MLYDPKWEAPAKIKADPFKLETLIAWLETQDPAKKYDYCDCHNCLLCQYFTAMGFLDVSVSCNELWHGLDREQSVIRFPEIFQHGVAHRYSRRLNKWTFGHALENARAIAG
jgi:hypothetical protein